MRKPMDIAALRQLAQGELVDLPGFTEGQPFTARLKRPSLLGLASMGAIPNPLLSVAEGMFSGKAGAAAKEAASFKDTAELFRIMAENALAAPTLGEIEEAGLTLTDLQLIAIFNYTQMGARALAGFRRVETGSEDNKPE